LNDTKKIVESQQKLSNYSKVEAKLFYQLYFCLFSFPKKAGF